MPLVGPDFDPVVPDSSRGVSQIVIAALGNGISPVMGSDRQGLNYILYAHTLRAGTNIAMTLAGGEIIIHSRSPILDASPGTYTQPVLTVDAQGRILGITSGTAVPPSIIGQSGITVGTLGGTYVVSLTAPLPPQTTVVGFGGVRVLGSNNTFFVSLASIVGVPTFVPFSLSATNGITVTDAGGGSLVVGLTQQSTILGTGIATVSESFGTFVIDVPAPVITGTLGVDVLNDNGSYVISLVDAGSPVVVEGSGAIGVTRVGNTFTVGPLISNIIGLDGIEVTDQSGTIVIAQTVQLAPSTTNILAGPGITVDTDNTGAYIIGASVTNQMAVAAGSNISVISDSGTYIISASAVPITVSAGQGIGIVQNGNDYLISAASLNIRSITAGAGVSVATNTNDYVINAAPTVVVGSGVVSVGTANGTYTISASLPTVRSITAGSNIQVVTNSTDYVINASMPAQVALVAGSNIALMTNAGTYTISASLPAIRSITAGSNIQVATNSTDYVIDASIPVAVAVAGSGAIAVTQSSNTYTVAANVVGSGGISVDQSSGTMVINNTLPYSTLYQGHGIVITDLGDNQYSIAASLSAPQPVVSSHDVLIVSTLDGNGQPIIETTIDAETSDDTLEWQFSPPGGSIMSIMVNVPANQMIIGKFYDVQTRIIDVVVWGTTGLKEMPSVRRTGSNSIDLLDDQLVGKRVGIILERRWNLLSER